LDKLDLRIMKILLANNGIPPGSPASRSSFRSMAKDLGVDQGTMRSRMKKLQKQGILKGWYLGVSPALAHQNVVHAWFQVEAGRHKGRLIDELVSVPGVERACNYLGPRVSLVLLYKTEKDLALSLKTTSKLARTDRLFHAQGAPLAAPLRLTETDVAVIENLRKDPWKPYAAAAKELEYSARTVKRRTVRMFEAGAIYIIPDLDLKAVQGIIPVELVVSYGSSELKAELNEKIASYLKDELLFSQIAEVHGYFALMVPNASMVESIENWVKLQKGAGEVHAQVLQDVVLSLHHYRSQKRVAGVDERATGVHRREEDSQQDIARAAQNNR
jgi:Lrp/AsnC family transcriptional regulator, leucine-responsive regulatory protein